MMMFAGFVPRSASADPPLYRITDLGSLNFIPSVNDIGTMGINNRGEVVYGFVVDNVMHAWLWVPKEHYGLGPGVMHDINVLTNSAGPAIARDINVNGIAVGKTGSLVRTSGFGVVWDFSTQPPTSIVLTAVLGGNPQWSSAYAINDSAPPIIVGESSDMGLCECPHESLNQPDTVTHPFRLSYEAPLPPMVELDVEPWISGYGRDVSTPLASLPLHIGGFGDCGTVFPQCILPGETGCPTRKDGSVWTGPIRNAQPDFGAESQVYGVNDLEQAVGYGLFNTGPCKQVALVWETLGAAPFNLGNAMPAGQSGHQSRAVAINNSATRQVVGANIDQRRALLWQKQSGTWTGIDLTSRSHSCFNGWTLMEAHDINDNGWIITWAIDPSLPQEPVDQRYHAVLLTPIPECTADIVLDGEVDVDDLFAVINQWGPCSLHMICSADTDLNCTVNIDDLFLVIYYWGPNCGQQPAAEEVPRTVQECIERYSNNPEKLQSCLQTVAELQASQP
jgi:hypothetical protein